MILGIDASNLRQGGGVTHLVEILRVVNPRVHGFDSVIVWGGEATLAKIENHDWLRKVHEPILDRSLLYRIFWQRFTLKRVALNAGCNLLFIPGGSDASGFKPIVTMSRNMLPFEWRELRRYGWALSTLKLLLLRWIQSRSLRRADGVIFLTKYARDAILAAIGNLRGKNVTIPHGINPRFLMRPRPQLRPEEYSDARPCRVLYVSHISLYKHQWHVAEAVGELRAEGVKISLDLVGPPAEGTRRLNETLSRVDPHGAFIKYCGAVQYEKLDEIYSRADIGVFASSCENMPNILMEGMAAGLPMACSRMGPMPEILGDSGVYFDPEDSSSISDALRKLIGSADLRSRLAIAGFARARVFTWQICAIETFRFLAEFTRKAGK